MKFTPAPWLRLALAVLVVVAGVHPTAQSVALPIVPGARGYGMQTRAAYGGSVVPTVYRVTNVRDRGVGSLRAALEAVGPRIVIFEISGTVDLESDIQVASPYLTIAGQTAPSPGITLRNHGIFVSTHDVLMQHLRIRPGGQTCNSGVLVWGVDGYNVVLDHLSVSWSQDENIGVGNGERPANVTVWKSIVAEGLYRPPGTENCTGGGTSPGHGMLVYSGSRGVSVEQTLFATNVERNPYMQADTSTLLVNNLVYQWAGPWGFFFANFDANGAGGGPAWYATVIGNRFVLGPNSTGPGDTAYMFVYFNNDRLGGNQLYRRDNTVANADGVVEELNQLAYDPNVATPPAEVPFSGTATTLASTDVEARVLAGAGARPTDRDAVDDRIVRNVVAREGDFVTDPDSVGGWPALAVNTRKLKLPSAPNSFRASGYTVLEEWLQGYARTLER